MSLQPIAPHVWRVNILNFVNAYFIQNADGEFVLVDTGVRPALAQLKGVAVELGRPPVAIILTHGHIDHSGCAGELARAWDVPIYAGRLEAPFLTDLDYYPPADPTVGGALAQVSRLLPPQKFDLSDSLELLPDNGQLDVLKGWQIVETPGHSAGHVGLWHEDDRVLLAGDALCTADMDSLVGLATLKPTQFARGGTPFVPDWGAMKHSLGKLADLEPVTVAAGHGIPLTGGNVPQQLRDFFHSFSPPAHGRYVETPAQSDERGVTFLPPAPPDPLPRNLALGALAGAGVFALLGSARRSGGLIPPAVSTIPTALSTIPPAKSTADLAGRTIPTAVSVVPPAVSTIPTGVSVVPTAVSPTDTAKSTADLQSACGVVFEFLEWEIGRGGQTLSIQVAQGRVSQPLPIEATPFNRTENDLAGRTIRPTG